MYIEPVKPRAFERHYSNPECQGTLIQQSDNWPTPKHSRKQKSAFYSDYEYRWNGQNRHFEEEEAELVSVPVPDGLKYDCAYEDRMQEWDYNKFKQCREAHLSNGSYYNSGFDSDPKKLLAFVKDYFSKDAVAVRTTYYYNVATGYGCPTIEYLYKEKGEWIK